MRNSTKIFNSFINFLLNLLLIKKNSWRREKYFYLFSSLILIPFNAFRGKKRLVHEVERQYDLISGSYISENYYKAKDRFCIANGKVEYLSSIENMKLIRKECNEVLKRFSFSSILEVGAGELTTLESIYSENDHITEMYGIDLSLNRLFYGLQEFKKRHELIPKVSKSNATELPFQDSSFDLVYSRHALEQMQDIFKTALSEMIRVSRKYIVLFEPSFEKGNLTQKLKMIRNNYFIGLDKFLKTRKDISILDSFLMKNSANPLNRTACYILKKKDSNQILRKFRGFVCPATNDFLQKKNGYYYSKKSNLAYPIIGGVPILDLKHSIYFDYENKETT